MNKVHQIQFQYLPIEDRLLLKINTTQREEYIFLLTRRFVSIFYPALSNILHHNQSVASHANKEVRNELIKIQKEKIFQQADTKTPYKSQNKHKPQTETFTHPLGAEAILLAKISNYVDKGFHQLKLEPEKGEGANFTIEQKFIHLLRGLLLKSLAKTNWGLTFQKDASPQPASKPAEKKTVH